MTVLGFMGEFQKNQGSIEAARLESGFSTLLLHWGLWESRFMELLCEIENINKSLCKPKFFYKLKFLQTKRLLFILRMPSELLGDEAHKNLSFCEMVMAVNDSCFPFECPSLAN